MKYQRAIILYSVPMLLIIYVVLTFVNKDKELDTSSKIGTHEKSQKRLVSPSKERFSSKIMTESNDSNAKDTASTDRKTVGPRDGKAVSVTRSLRPGTLNSVEKIVNQKSDGKAQFPEAVVDIKNRHVRRLLSLDILERESWHDASAQRYIEASLVKDDQEGTYRHFIIQEIRNQPDEDPVATYVQVANHLLVGFFDEPSERVMADFLEKYGLSLYKKLTLQKTYLFEFNEISVNNWRRLEELIEQDSLVDYVEANSLSYSTEIVPNDQLFDRLWGLKNSGTDPFDGRTFQADFDIGAVGAWNNLTDCSDIIVAVMDTGIDPTHPDLRANVLADQGRDFTSNNRNDFIDRQGHGTHVSGTIGAVGNNGIGIAGVCWNAAIIPVKVLGDAGFGTLQGIIDGHMYIVNETDAKVVNLSLGGGPASNAELNAIRAQEDKGNLMIMAAGNENNNNDINPAYPASYNNPAIISVAATHGGGDLSNFSNFGSNTVHISAPGEDVVSTIPLSLARDNDPERAYSALSGTSMAAPHVAGAVALLWSFMPSMTAEQVKAEVLASSSSGNLSKPIDNSRLLNLANLLEVVKSKAQFSGLEGGERISLNSSNRYSFSLTLDEKYAGIEKVEILMGDRVLGTSQGSTSRVEVALPLGFAKVDLIAKATDTEGRVFFSDPVELSLDLEKILSFSELDTSQLEGNVPCNMVKVQENGESVRVYSASLESEQACQKLCNIIGPLTYSSLGEIRCASTGSNLYVNGGE